MFVYFAFTAMSHLSAYEMFSFSLICELRCFFFSFFISLIKMSTSSKNVTSKITSNNIPQRKQFSHQGVRNQRNNAGQWKPIWWQTLDAAALSCGFSAASESYSVEYYTGTHWRLCC